MPDETKQALRALVAAVMRTPLGELAREMHELGANVEIDVLPETQHELSVIL